MRQIEVAEMMISSNRYSLAYANVMLAATPQSRLVKPIKKNSKLKVSRADIAIMEREMEHLQTRYSSAEASFGESMFSLVVAKGYFVKLFRNSMVHTS